MNGFTMIGNDLRLLYEAEDLSDQTGLLAIKILYKIECQPDRTIWYDPFDDVVLFWS